MLERSIRYQLVRTGHDHSFAPMPELLPLRFAIPNSFSTLPAVNAPKEHCHMSMYRCREYNLAGFQTHFVTFRTYLAAIQPKFLPFVRRAAPFCSFWDSTRCQRMLNPLMQRRQPRWMSKHVSSPFTPTWR